jgi:hypothetical protein
METDTSRDCVTESTPPALNGITMQTERHVSTIIIVV